MGSPYFTNEEKTEKARDLPKVPSEWQGLSL